MDCVGQEMEVKNPEEEDAQERKHEDDREKAKKDAQEKDAQERKEKKKEKKKQAREKAAREAKERKAQRKANLNFKDSNGNALAEGDIVRIVATQNSHCGEEGEISRFTPKRVRVDLSNGDSVTVGSSSMERVIDEESMGEDNGDEEGEGEGEDEDEDDSYDEDEDDYYDEEERPATYRQRKVLHILAWHQRGDRLGVLATASTRLK